MVAGLRKADRLLRELERARARWWLVGVTDVGDGVHLDGKPFIENNGTMRLGQGVQLGSRPVQSHFVVGYGATLEIGRGSVVAYGAAVSALSEVSLGADVRIGPFVVIMDSDFHVVGDRHKRPEPSPIRIGKGVTIESRVTILRGTTIGDGARVRAGGVVSGTVAAGACVAGVPATLEGAGAGAGSGDLRALVMDVLGLSARPAWADGPEQIAQWDSLGTLKLLLAIERHYGVTIREDMLKSAQSVERLAEILEAARRESNS